MRYIEEVIHYPTGRSFDPRNYKQTLVAPTDLPFVWGHWKLRHALKLAVLLWGEDIKLADIEIRFER